MKKIFFIVIIFLLFVNITNAQSIMSSPKYNGLKEISAIPDSMSFSEFLKVQRELDWKKIIVSTILPGYIHFYADKPALGWVIAGTRIAGGVMMGWAMYDQYKITNAVDFAIDISTDEEQSRTERNTILFSTGLVLNMIGFAFDWAHGDWVIEIERNEVYFKYGLDEERRNSLGISYNTQYKIPIISVSLQL